jgi:hypothetical protein
MGPVYLAGRGAGNFSNISSETMVAAHPHGSVAARDGVVVPAQIDATIGGNPAANTAAEWRLRL